MLTSLLPIRVINEVKPFLEMDEDEFPEKDAYLQVKKEIIRIFGPSEASNFERAMGRVLSGKPSQLCRQLINDMCDHNLNGCCCAKWIFGKWHRELPSAVKQAVAHYKFSKDTMKEILELADKVYESTRPTQAVAAVQAASVHDEGFHPDWPSAAADEAEEVAAIRRGPPGRGGRGRGRGAPQNRGGARGGANSGRIFYTKDNPRWKTPRHPDLPPFHACKKHWTWGKSCHKCGEPDKCPWKQFISPKDNN